MGSSKHDLSREFPGAYGRHPEERPSAAQMVVLRSFKVWHPRIVSRITRCGADVANAASRDHTFACAAVDVRRRRTPPSGPPWGPLSDPLSGPLSD